jgi:Uri superfamily endonuclease
MASNVSNHAGTYVLILQMKKNQTIKIGKLGTYKFNKGYYGYVGSAFGPGGLIARIRHHLRKSRNPHWHVDYLRRRSSPVQIWWSTTRTRREHDWAAVMGKLFEASHVIKGFGASDCNCFSHLFYFERNPKFIMFNKILTDAGFEAAIKTVLSPETGKGY